MMEMKPILVCIPYYDVMLSSLSQLWSMFVVSFHRRHKFGKSNTVITQRSATTQCFQWENYVYFHSASYSYSVEFKVFLTGQHNPERELFLQLSINKPRLTSLQMLHHLPPFYLTTNQNCLEKEHGKNNVFRGKFSNI
jgi:hypothetical protein